MQNYFANFIKTGNPNGNGLPNWPATNTGIPSPVMHIDVRSTLKKAILDQRYKVLEAIAAQQN